MPNIDDVLNETLDKKSEKIESSEVSDNTWTIYLPRTRIHTLEELLEYCKVDLTVWQVERFTCNKWEIGVKVGEGENTRVEVEPLFQVKAFLKRNVELIEIRKEIESLKEDAKKKAKIPKSIVRSIQKSDNLLELVIPDLHMGKLSWAKETGFQDYDSKIAEETFYRAVDTLLDRVKNYKFDKIVLGVGNDLLQADNFNSTTTKGTVVHTDTRYQKSYVTTRRMMVNTIEKLRVIAPVDVLLIPGNHDTQSNFTLGDSLECWFHSYKDVCVNNSPIPHKYFVWGDNLVVLTHGDKGKQADYGIWIATTYPKEFGKSKFREVHIGHRHKSMVDEKFGVRVRTLSALCPPDQWHAAQNFVSNLRSAEGFVWNKQQGLIAQVYHTEID
jgi:acetone carboxylase gamma subunit/uncharacterized protein YeeX (DUF496 family)